MKAITIERRSWKLRCYRCLANMFVGRGGIEPPSSDFQSAALTTSATTPKFHLFNCHKWQNLNMSFLTHFSLFSQSYVCYIYIILQIFSKSKSKTIKNKTQVSILSLLRLISGIYVVFNLNSLYMYAIT